MTKKSVENVLREASEIHKKNTRTMVAAYKLYKRTMDWVIDVQGKDSTDSTRKKETKVVYSKQEIYDIFDYATEHGLKNSKGYFIFLFSLCTGLRSNEYYNIKWSGL